VTASTLIQQHRPSTLTPTTINGDQQAEENINSKDICGMSAAELAERVRAKQLSPTEVRDAVLDRMGRLAHCARFLHTHPRARARAGQPHREGDNRRRPRGTARV
jgi:hypothetical protein